MRTSLPILGDLPTALASERWLLPFDYNQEFIMLQVHDGQCGLCVHFGHHHMADPELVQIRTQKSAPEGVVEECDHPNNAPLHLKVTPISGCDGFEPAPMN
jgi:hypothetical protein